MVAATAAATVGMVMAATVGMAIVATVTVAMAIAGIVTETMVIAAKMAKPAKTVVQKEVTMGLKATPAAVMTVPTAAVAAVPVMTAVLLA